jgi:hypothetical protein
VFNKRDPIVVGVEVVEGIAKVGTPLCVPTQQGIDLGRIASLELNHKVWCCRACAAPRVTCRVCLVRSRLAGA